MEEQVNILNVTKVCSIKEMKMLRNKDGYLEFYQENYKNATFFSLVIEVWKLLGKKWKKQLIILEQDQLIEEN